ncbi:MAG: tRNA (5-methylaminomethyl-2-thiouridine)(34)-methyltransferase MnmD, partial [Caulobacteraceae bacterium]
MAEARAVFLAGCGLPERWSDRRRFVVGELGFGTGLNLIALLDVWRRTRPPGGHLHFFSIEAHPMAAAEAARALSAWPEIAPLAALLTARWPGAARGFHRLDFPELAASADIALMEAGAALEAWTGHADAWFLDGFSPARNPAMWRPELLQAVARRSAPGARAATFTVAGTVRRDLAAAGFIVERRQGFGRKRHRLEARLVGEPVAERDWPRVAVIGGGIAGASLNRAFAAAGVTARLFSSPGPKASDGPAALVAPRLDAGLEAPAALFAQAFARAIGLYGDTPACVIARGARQLTAGEKDVGRFRKIAASDLFEPGSVRLVTGEADAASALLLDRALVIDPEAVLDAWLGPVGRAAVARLEHHTDSWRLLDEGGEELGRADIVCLAAGHASSDLWPLPLSPVRGQASVAGGVDWPVATLFA